MVSGLTKENASKVIEFARTHSSRETDQEMARLNPKKAKPDSVKSVSGDHVEIRAQISLEVHKKMKRAESLQAQRGKPTSLEAILDAALEEYLNRHDPVRRAERAEARKVKKRETAEKVGTMAQVSPDHPSSTDQGAKLRTHRAGEV